MTRAPALELRDIHKHFGPVRALQGASFTLDQGEIHALLGENGAGKTTLIHVAFGMVQPERGTVLRDGRVALLRSPRDAQALGIGMVHQHFTSVPALTVAENLALAAGGGGPALAVSDLPAGLWRGLDRETPVESLSVGLKQRLEVVKALVTGARVLLLDEPTAVLVPGEVEELARTIRSFAEHGGSVVLITHKLSEVFAMADRVTVLRHGRVAMTGPVAEESPKSLAAAMLGTDAATGTGAGTGTAVGRSPDRPPGAPASAPTWVLRADRLVVAPLEGRGPGVSDGTIEVRSGEIVGIAAIEGNGHRELLLALAGAVPHEAGNLEVRGAVALVPEDRTTEGLIPDFTLTENVVLGLGRAVPRGRVFLDWSAADRLTVDLISAHDIRAPGSRVPASSLSGGNQQKLLLGRALAGKPQVLIAENPARGLDIRATDAVFAKLRETAADGVAVLVYSSDLDEVLALADRVVVVAGGKTRQVLLGTSRDDIGTMMLGLDPT